jgi:VWFA-related protein
MTTRKIMGRALTGAWIALVSLGAATVAAQEAAPAAQEEPAAQFDERLQVIEVLVDVLATDRKGRVIKGLTTEDFLVEEDGEPRPVTSVTFYTTRYEDLPPGADGSAPAPEGFPPPDLPASRYFILFFHDQSQEAADPASLTRARLEASRDANRWVETEMGPSDWIAVVRFDSSLTVKADFSQDRLEIREAIEQATMNQRSSALRPSTRARREHPGAGPSLTAGLPHVSDLDRASLRIEDAVALVAQASRPIIGRKNLVLFTLGFGRTDSAFAAADRRYYPPMQAALNDSNTAVYPIDLSGPGNQAAQSNFLGQLADETGGIYFSSFTRYLDPLRDIGRYNTGYYLLSFSSEVPAGERGYRSFLVKSKDKKVKVRARRGYVYGPRSE